MTNQVEYYNSDANPLDSVEDVLSDYNWIYSRMNDENLIVEIAGKSCQYRLSFIWQEQMNALQIRCQYDIKINPENMALAATALMDANASLWMGHFELAKNSLNPCFRQTCLMHEHDKTKFYTHIENLVDISLIQCERYMSLFQLLGSNEAIDRKTLSFAMMETAGES